MKLCNVYHDSSHSTRGKGKETEMVRLVEPRPQAETGAPRILRFWCPFGSISSTPLSLRFGRNPVNNEWCIWNSISTLFVLEKGSAQRVQPKSVVKESSSLTLSIVTTS